MRALGLVLALAAVVMVAGCSAVALGPVPALLTPEMKGPVAGVDNNVGMGKTGKAEAQGILIFGWGDASIKAAMEEGKISKVHHVDNVTMNIFGIYAKYTTVVYGE